MENRIWKWYLPIMMVAIAIICVSIWYVQFRYQYRPEQFQNVGSECGEWDLLDIDFDDMFIRTYGNAEYIPDALLTPEEFDARADEAVFDDAGTRVATYRLRLYVPEGNYMLAMKSIIGAERIYINGELYETVGTPGLTYEESETGWKYFNFEVTPENGMIELVRQSANFVHRDSGDIEQLLLGRPDTIRQTLALSTDIASFTMGMFFALFLAHIQIFVLLRGYRVNLFFSLLCLTWCVRVGVTDMKVVLSWFPQLSWLAVRRVEYLTVPVAGGLLFLTVHSLFPTVLPRWFRMIAASACVSFGVLFLLLSPQMISYAMLAFQVSYVSMLSVGMVILTVRYLHILRSSGRDGSSADQTIYLIGVILFVVLAISDAFYHNEHYLGGIDSPLSSLGMMVFTLLQMIAVLYGTRAKVEHAYAAEQALHMEAQSLRQIHAAKEQFLRNLSHDLQMPITVASGFAQLTSQIADDEVVDLAAIKDNMRRIEEEAGRMGRMIQQLLDIASAEDGKFKVRLEPLDIAAVLSSVVNDRYPAMNQHGNQLVLEMDDKLPLIRGDRDRMIQVMLNLLSNANRHTREGTITLAAHHLEDYLVITVSDTGEGIAPELLKSLFSPYPEKRSPEGNGLGLYISAQIIKAHQGYILAESTLNAGSKFSIYLPVRTEEA